MSAAGGTRRLFFALWPEPGQQAELAQAAKKAVAESRGRAVASESLHITLAFLGSVPELRLGDLAAVARRVARSAVLASPLEISFERTEYWKKAQVLCAVRDGGGASEAGVVRVAGEPPPADGVREASRLADALKTELLTAGFTPDLKPFRAHVTLARKVPRRSDWCGRELHRVSWRFTEFSLMESRTRAEGALYSVVESWLLSRARME